MELQDFYNLIAEILNVWVESETYAAEISTFLINL